jgi:hypothetical protein
MMKLPKSTISRCIAGYMVLSLFLSFGQVAAQNLRDPTLPPPEAGLSGTEPGGKSQGIEPGAMTVIVRNGRPYLVVGTRLYAQGQKLGQARIERISETEIWLREGGVLRKIPQFSGIQRSTVTPVTMKPVCAASSSKKSPSVAPCAGVQPRGLSQ